MPETKKEWKHKAWQVVGKQELACSQYVPSAADNSASAT